MPKTSLKDEPEQSKQEVLINIDDEAKESITPTTTPGGFARSFTVMYAKLLTEQDLNKVRDRFHEDIDFVLEEAIRKHVR